MQETPPSSTVALPQDWGVNTGQWVFSVGPTTTAAVPAIESAQPPKVELHVACTNLPNLDILSKTDAIVVLYIPQDEMKTGRDVQWKEFGRTEVIWDNLNPQFIKSFTLPYYFERIQPLKFEVYHVNDPKRPIDSKYFIGSTIVRLGELMASQGRTITKVLDELSHHSSKKYPAKIIIYGEERVDTSAKHLSNNVDVRKKYIQVPEKWYTFEFYCTKLDRKDVFGKSDPFFVIQKSTDQADWIPVFKSEVIYKTLHPHWKRFTISEAVLNNGNPKRALRIEVWDWNRSGTHELIGQFKTSTQELLEKREFEVINLKKRQKKRKYKNSGVLTVQQALEEKRERKVLNPYYGFNSFSFLEYIAGGCEINLIIAIDWTKSNGNPSSCSSLHYLNHSGSNEYVAAIQSVGKILVDYDSDKMIPVYGFGGRNSKTGKVSFKFALNGNERSPEVYGIDGVLAAYKNAFNEWDLYGPTNFAPVIRDAADRAREFSPSRQNYYVLLILTDGEISDMDATTHEIVEASALPLSIVIVGVGNEDFAKMDVLDADEEPLVSCGKEMERDIVQFVPFRKYRQNPAQLAEEVLKEIPRQLTSFMSIAGVPPRPPPSAAFAHWWHAGVAFPQSSLQDGGTTGYPLQPQPYGSGGFTASSAQHHLLQSQPYGSGGFISLPQHEPQQPHSPNHSPYGSGGVFLPQPYGSAHGLVPPTQQPQPVQQWQSPQETTSTVLEVPTQEWNPGQSHSPHSAHQREQATSPPATNRNDDALSKLDPQLRDLLVQLNYPQFADVFLRESLTYEALKEFDKDDLKELGLPAGPRIALYKLLQK